MRQCACTETGIGMAHNSRATASTQRCKGAKKWRYMRARAGALRRHTVPCAQCRSVVLYNSDIFVESNYKGSSDESQLSRRASDAEPPSAECQALYQRPRVSSVRADPPIHTRRCAFASLPLCVAAVALAVLQLLLLFCRCRSVSAVALAGAADQRTRSRPSDISTALPATRTAVIRPSGSLSTSISSRDGRPISRPCCDTQRSVPVRGVRAAR